MAANPFYVPGPTMDAIIDAYFAGESFRGALVTSSYTPNQTSHGTWSDYSANEVPNGNGYATHGLPIVLTVSATGLVATVDGEDLSWTSSTIADAAYLAIVRDANADGSLAGTDEVVFVSELEDGGNLSTTNGTLSVTMNASGICTFTATAAA